jgi:hypothetical protein
MRVRNDYKDAWKESYPSMDKNIWHPQVKVIRFLNIHLYKNYNLPKVS